MLNNNNTNTDILVGLNPTSNVHWVTKDALPSGWILAKSYTIFHENTNYTNTKMLYECTTNWKTNFISARSDCEGKTLIRNLGKIYSTSMNSTSPLYRCFDLGTDHYVSSNNLCENSGDKNEGILGYYILSR